MKKKRTRRYREKYSDRTLTVASTHSEHRIHDFIKGWGTVAKDGKSILWDCWRPITKKRSRELEKHWEKNPPFSKIAFPNIKGLFPMEAPNLTIEEIVSVQPMKEIGNKFIQFCKEMVSVQPIDETLKFPTGEISPIKDNE